MNLYLSKPYTIEQLKDSVSQLLHRKFRIRSHCADFDRFSISKHSGHAEISDTSILDFTVIENIEKIESHSEKALFPALLAGYESQMADKLQEMKANFESNSIESVKKTAHAIKSMSLNVGAKLVAEIAMEIEKSEIFVGENAVNLMSRLESTHSITIVALKNYDKERVRR